MLKLYLRLRRFVAILIGIFFLITGLLKLMDPVGTMLIVTEYFKFFHLQFLQPVAKLTGILLALLESITGVGLITGMMRKVFAWITLWMLGLFTILTLILWLVNPVMDCGCFGEAFHLTHLQSLLKNVVLLLLAVFAFTPMRHLGFPKPRRKVAAWVGWAALLVATIYCNRHIPLVDFTEFATGAELFASENTGSSVQESYQSAYIYEKDGHQESFTLDNLPDSTWTFVKVENLSRNAGEHEYPILSFRDAEGEYQDELAARGRVVVFSVYEPTKAPWEKIRERCEAVAEAGARPLLIVTSLPGELPLQGLQAYMADYKTLITLNRDNGGATYFEDGELIAKWGVRDFPKHPAEDLKADTVDLSTHISAKKRIQAQGFCLFLGAVLILL